MTTPNEGEIKNRLLKAVDAQKRLRQSQAAAPGDTQFAEEPLPEIGPGDILAELDIDVSPDVAGIS